MTKRILILLAALFASNALAIPVEIPTNKDGSPVTGLIAPVYDPGQVNTRCRSTWALATPRI